MTDDRTALMELIEQWAVGLHVRGMLTFTAERITEIEGEARIGADHGSRAPDRTDHSNDY